MRYIIINADDFGLNKAVTDSIIEFIEKNLISSTTILANGLDFDSAVEYAISNNNISYGVHLNLTVLKSLTTSDAFSKIGLMTDNSYKSQFNYRVTPELAMAIEDEWSAQIEKCLNSNLKISHLDSHHHVHTLPSLFAILKKIQKKYNIKKVRNTYNLSRDFPIIKSIKKKIWSFALKNYYKTKTTDYFMSYAQFINFDKLPRSGLFELMCHPAGKSSDEENKLILKHTIKKIGDFNFINYNDI